MPCSQSQIEIVRCPEHTTQFMRFGYAECIRNLLEFSDRSHIYGFKENPHLFGSHHQLPFVDSGRRLLRGQIGEINMPK